MFLQRVLKGENRPFSVVSLSGEVATATAKEGTEEIIEVQSRGRVRLVSLETACKVSSSRRTPCALMSFVGLHHKTTAGMCA